jgi:hypothetical protein
MKKRMEKPEETRKAAQPAILLGVVLVGLLIVLVIGIVVLG